MIAYQTRSVDAGGFLHEFRRAESLPSGIAGFLGVAPNHARRAGEVIPIENWSQFIKEYVTEIGTGTWLSHAVYGFFQNGGTLCYVVNIGKSISNVRPEKLEKSLSALEKIGGISMIVAPGFYNEFTRRMLLTFCEKTSKCIALFDLPAKVIGAEHIANYMAHSEGLLHGMENHEYCRFFFPWIEVMDSLFPSNRIMVPSSGHMAGVFSRLHAHESSEERESIVNGVLNPVTRISESEAQLLTGHGIYCLRFIPGAGVRLHGPDCLCDLSIKNL